MKLIENKLRFLMALVVIVFFACKDDDSILGKDVVFSGRVLFEDNLEPIDGNIAIVGMEEGAGFPRDGVTSTWEGILDNQGGFDTSFDSDLEIDYFDLMVFFNNEEQSIFLPNIVDCSGNENCSRLPIDGNYENMTILVERPE